MIDVHTIATTGLGDRSYLAHEGRVALVIDPQRDIDRVLALAEESSGSAAADAPCACCAHG